MHDRIETIGKSTIQHGSFNNRIYLIKLNRSDHPKILTTLDSLAKENSYEKIFAKIPFYALEGFINNGYRKEAVVSNYYNGKKPAFFMGKFFSKSREKESRLKEIISTIELARKKAGNLPNRDNMPFVVRPAKSADAKAIASCYRDVFDSYPFPIEDSAYIQSAMKNNTDFFTAWKDGKLAAVSSAEKDPKNSNVEMTDFATRKVYRGKGIALYLLNQMEEHCRDQGYQTAYTIARAFSPGMNITFGKMGYQFSGTLINNTQISGSIQSMNVWYKSLQGNETFGKNNSKSI